MELKVNYRNSKIYSWFLSQSVLAIGYLGFYVLEACLKFDSAIVSWGVNCILMNVLMGCENQSLVIVKHKHVILYTLYLSYLDACV